MGGNHSGLTSVNSIITRAKQSHTLLCHLKYSIYAVLALVAIVLNIGVSQMGAGDKANVFQSGVSYGAEIVIDKSLITVTENVRLELCKKTPCYGLLRPVSKVSFDSSKKEHPVKVELVLATKDIGTRPERVPFLINDDWPLVKLFYLGEKEVNLPFGFHSYTLQYTLEGAIIPLEKFDEFVWDLVGTWGRNVDQLSFTVRLPSYLTVNDTRFSAEVKDASSWRYDEMATRKGTPLPYVIKDDHSIQFRNDRPIKPDERVILNMRFPKGTLSNAS